jgi:hypothetical protein
METARVRHRLPMVAWEAEDNVLHNGYLIQNQPQFGYVEDFSRGYSTGRHDGTLAGLVIGTIAGVVAALMLGNVIGPMW